MIELLLGRGGSGKSDFILNRLLSFANKDCKIYYIVPEQVTLEAEKKLATSSPTPIFNVKVSSFDRLSQETLTEVGGANREYIDEIGEIMLLKYITKNTQGQFPLYGSSLGKSGFLANMKSLLSEIKSSKISPEDLDRSILSMEDSLLKKKLLEINQIYSEYERYTKEKYIDSASRLSALSDKIIK